MARSWNTKNKNIRNVLITGVLPTDYGDVDAASKTIYPTANVTMAELQNVKGDSELEIDGSRSQKGDLLILHSKGAAAHSITLAGDADALAFTIPIAGGMAFLIFDGTKYTQPIQGT